jgi:F-type H+-transporting ATPase subunit b
VNITATLFGQIGTFIVLVWFVNRYLWNPMTKMLQARTERIVEGLEAAERGKRELELAEKSSTERLRRAKQDASHIVDAAHKRADQIIEEAKQQARLEGNRQLDAAKAEIEREKNRAKEQLREQVVSLSLVCAEKVLAREINASDHNEFIEKMIEKL